MYTPEELKQKLMILAQNVCDEAGVDLIELNVRRHGGEVIVQILADFPMGGINLEQCSLLNRCVVEVIDRNNAIDGEYSLELSSPGLDRPLSHRKDYLRVLNQEIRCVLKQPVEGKREHTGILKEVRDTQICVKTQKYGEVTIPIDQVTKALVVI